MKCEVLPLGLGRPIALIDYECCDFPHWVRDSVSYWNEMFQVYVADPEVSLCDEHSGSFGVWPKVLRTHRHFRLIAAFCISNQCCELKHVSGPVFLNGSSHICWS
jgi:hypothetical protein